MLLISLPTQCDLGWLRFFKGLRHSSLAATANRISRSHMLGVVQGAAKSIYPKLPKGKLKLLDQLGRASTVVLELWCW